MPELPRLYSLKEAAELLHGQLTEGALRRLARIGGLLPHLRRWREKDLAGDLTHVITFNRKPIRDPYGAWEKMRIAAGDGGQPDAPHVLRHKSASWFVAQGYDLAEVSSYLGMSVGTLTRVYWHRSPQFQRNISQTAQETPKKPMNRQ